MRRLLLSAALLSMLAEPAAASLWGYQGLVTMPDARVAKDRELEVGLLAIALPNRPLATTAFARYGLWSSLEASLVYGVPGHPWLSGSLKYQLMRQTPSNPTSVALGTTLLGVPAGGPLAGTGYFLALTRDVGPWGSVHAGFEGDLALNTRLMIGLELPLAGLGRLMAEGRGPQAGTAPYGSLGVELSPLPWLRLAAGTVGDPTLDWWSRGAYAGGSLHALLPEVSRWLPSPSPRSAPTPGAAAAPVRPAPSPSGSVRPPALPTTTLIGRVMGSDGTPKAGYTAVLSGSGRQALTNNSGYFFFPGLAPGSYQVQILDRASTPVATGTAQLATEPQTLTLQVKEGRPPAVQERRGSVAGSVADAQNGAPLAEARLVVVGSGVSVLAVSNAAGRFQVIDLPVGDYQVRAERKGYRSETGRARIDQAALNPEIRLTLTRERP